MGKMGSKHRKSSKSLKPESLKKGRMNEGEGSKPDIKDLDHTIIEQAGVVIIACDTKGRIIRINQFSI